MTTPYRPPARPTTIPQRPESFARVLSLLRARQGISQSGLARKIDRDHSLISRIEAGHRTASRETITRIAAALDLPDQERDELFHAAGYHVGPILTNPDLIRLAILLDDDSVPSWVVAHIERQIGELTRMAELTAKRREAVA